MPIRGGGGVVGTHGAEKHTGDVIPDADQDFGGYRLKGLKRMNTIPVAADIGTDGLVLYGVDSGKTVTAYGNAQIDTAQSKFSGASGLFDGAGDYLSLADSADWYFGTGDFTIDFWVRFNALPVSGGVQNIVCQFIDSNNYWRFSLYNRAGTLEWHFLTRSGGVDIIYVPENPTLLVNTWYHVALVRSGNSFYIFQDGTQLGTTDTDADSVPDLAATLKIAMLGALYEYYFNGWLDEVRISKGIARWTSNFTPPTASYKWDAYTVLLLHMDGTDGSQTFIDSSAITGRLYVNIDGFVKYVELT